MVSEKSIVVQALGGASCPICEHLRRHPHRSRHKSSSHACACINEGIACAPFAGEQLLKPDNKRDNATRNHCVWPASAHQHVASNRYQWCKRDVATCPPHRCNKPGKPSEANQRRCPTTSIPIQKVHIECAEQSGSNRHCRRNGEGPCRCVRTKSCNHEKQQCNQHGTARQVVARGCNVIAQSAERVEDSELHLADDQRQEPRRAKRPQRLKPESIAVQCCKDTHVLVFNVIAIEESSVACIHHEHGAHSDNNRADDSAYFTLASTC